MEQKKTSEIIKILMIEDENIFAHFIKLLLEEPFCGNKFQVNIKQTLKDGLEELKVFEPDVIILDLFLPDSQGFYTFTAIKDGANKIPILVITGMNDMTIATELVRNGARDVIIKGDVSAKRLIWAIWLTSQQIF